MQESAQVESKRLVLENSVEEIELDLSEPRVVRVIGKTADGRTREWLLKVTNNQKLVLV
jgi:hypothetical protein